MLSNSNLNHMSSTLRLSTLVRTARLLEMSSFQTFSGVKSRSKLSIEETSKPTRDDVKIQRGELANILR